MALDALRDYSTRLDWPDGWPGAAALDRNANELAMQAFDAVALLAGWPRQRARSMSERRP